MNGNSQTGGWREIFTPAWTFWVLHPQAPVGSHLVYVTATGSTLARLREEIASFVRSGAAQASVVRLAREPRVVDQVNQLPDWTGKAITFYAGSPAEAARLAQRLDSELAGSGYTGPPVLRARPAGGRSGLIFTQAAADMGSVAPAEARRGKLSALIGDAD